MSPVSRTPLRRSILALTWIHRVRVWLLCNNVETPFDIMGSLSGNAIILTWLGDSTNVGVYFVERSENNGPYQAQVWVGAGAMPGVHPFAWADTNVNLASRYCYRLTAQHTDGRRGCPADPVCVAGCNGLPTPFDVIAIAWGASENRLQWKCDAANISYYRIERAIGGPFDFQHLTDFSAGTQSNVQQYSYSDTGIQGGMLYCYRIASEQADGTRGCFTDPVCAGTQIF